LCSEGDEDAWHELIDIIGPLIFSICRKSRLTHDESFDIYGQVCFDLVGNIGTIKSPARILSFVATITRRKIFNFYEKMRLADYFKLEVVPMLSESQEEPPDLTYENMQRRELLMKAMTKLPTRQYRLLKALFFDPGNPSYKEIARKLQVPASSIGPTRARALEKLGRILKRELYKF
ncbi:MAG TPA: sigma-70 family RNA polymerase sigma factor, partial [candidate division Zixibacteria bacterium]|nr:sigma-70 family RNA polymerase sigma factor [candidate division Zixibacteria bacterium]